MTTYYKAIRPDGNSFHDQKFAWATEVGGITAHPKPAHGSDIARHYLSVSDAIGNCTGMAWPCRLLEVEPVGETWVPDAAGLPNKVAGAAFRTVRELPAQQVFGKYADQIVQIIERCERLTADELKAFAAWHAARYAARDAARDAARYAARYAARDAALAWLVKDEISDEQFRTLTDAWYAVITDEVRP